MPKKRRSLEAIALERGITVEELVTQALEKADNPNAAAMLLGVTRSSIVHAMDNCGLEIAPQKTVVRKVKR